MDPHVFVICEGIPEFNSFVSGLKCRQNCASLQGNWICEIMQESSSDLLPRLTCLKLPLCVCKAGLVRAGNVKV